MRSAFYTVALIVASLSVAYGVSASSRESQDAIPTDPVAAEIRQLRLAIEQQAGLHPRVQLALGRVSLAQQAVKDALARADKYEAVIARPPDQFEPNDRQRAERAYALAVQELTAERERLTDAQRQLDALQRELGQKQDRPD